VVGLDGSAGDGPACAWATGEASARHTSLRTVVFAPTGSLEQGHRRDTLAAAAAASDLLVVGATTTGDATRWLHTCIPRGASRGSPGPIVVVRGRAGQPLRRIVVGIGSSPTAAVVEWASDEASRHDAELVVVHAWQPNPASGRSVRRKDLARSDARCIVDLAVRHSETRASRPAHGQLVEAGDAASVLTAASENADLIVVGSRDGGFRTMTFGRVALLLVEQATCPVALIPPQLRATRR
jgi:nucleotide-binding universal stress UspA family protein